MTVVTDPVSDPPTEVLVRPDGVVAWAADAGATPDTVAGLDAALHRWAGRVEDAVPASTPG